MYVSLLVYLSILRNLAIRLHNSKDTSLILAILRLVRTISSSGKGCVEVLCEGTMSSKTNSSNTNSNGKSIGSTQEGYDLLSAVGFQLRYKEHEVVEECLDVMRILCEEYPRCTYIRMIIYYISNIHNDLMI